MDIAANTSKPAENNFLWNFSVNIADIAFYTVASNLVSQSTILPLLVSQLTSSKMAMGLIPTIFSMGFLLPQLLTASYTERLKRKLPFLALFSGLGERLPYLLIALVVLWFGASQPGLTLVAMLGLLAMVATTAGLLTPAWYDLIAKVIPIERRGLWSGLGFGMGAFMGIAGAALAGQILEWQPFPRNFAICFFAAFFFQVLSYTALVLNREPDSEIVKPAIGFLAYFKQLPAIIRRDRNYQIYLISRSIANLGSMASGFFIVYGVERFHIGGAEVGWLTSVLVGSQTVMNLLLGSLGDRKGHKIVLTIGALGGGLAALSVLLGQGKEMIYLTFILLGAAMAAENVSSLNIILEFCSSEDRPTYIGLTNTLLAPTRAAAPLIGGWLATWQGYPVLFLGAVLCSVAGAALIGGWLREPRHLKPYEGRSDGAE